MHMLAFASTMLVSPISIPARTCPRAVVTAGFFENVLDALSGNADQMKRIRASFNAFDDDNSGYIDRSEMRAALLHYGIDVSEELSERVLSRYDQYGEAGPVEEAEPDPDGQLDMDEFAAFVKDTESGFIVVANEPKARDRNAKAGKRARVRSFLGRLVGKGKKGKVVPTTRDASSVSNAPRKEVPADVYLLDDVPLNSDLVYYRLEKGGSVHCSTSFQPVMTSLLIEEAEMRGRDGAATIAEWERNGQLRFTDERPTIDPNEGIIQDAIDTVEMLTGIDIDGDGTIGGAAAADADAAAPDAAKKESVAS